MYPTEEIPDKDHLYYRIHKNNLIGDEVAPGSFREQGDGDARSMSTDWSKYSTPALSLSRSRVPANNLIVSFGVGQIRDTGLRVNHRPLFDPSDPKNIVTNNQSHSDVVGLGDSKALKKKYRLDLMELYTLELPVEG